LPGLPPVDEIDETCLLHDISYDSECIPTAEKSKRFPLAYSALPNLSLPLLLLLPLPLPTSLPPEHAKSGNCLAAAARASMSRA
jgi:hypothetical protein